VSELPGVLQELLVLQEWLVLVLQEWLVLVLQEWRVLQVWLVLQG
jgi:hypothetical protein